MSDKILKHPDADSYNQTWDFRDMKVTVERTDKKPLMAYECLAALEQVRFYILSCLHEGPAI